MRIFYINNAGAGFADHVDIPDGTTIEKFFYSRFPDGNPSDHLLAVGGRPITSDHVLKDGDRVSITALKVEGAL